MKIVLFIILTIIVYCEFGFYGESGELENVSNLSPDSSNWDTDKGSSLIFVEEKETESKVENNAHKTRPVKWGQRSRQGKSFKEVDLDPHKGQTDQSTESEEHHRGVGFGRPKYFTLPNEVDGWIENITCEVCEYVVRKIQALANDSSAYDKYVNETIHLCIYFKISDERICSMMIDQYKDEFQYVLVHLLLLPGEACGIVLGRSCSTPYYPGNMWNVTLPDTPKPPPQPPTPPKPESPTLRFVQITDMHIDFQYAVGSPADCSEPLCCRTNVNGSSPYGKAGKYGDYDNCDIPQETVAVLFEHLASIQDEYDYIIFTGDIPAHDLWNQSRSAQVQHIRTLDRLFQTYLPFKPVYYAVGNHESSPCDSFPPPKLNVEDMSWLFDTLADVWGRWLPPETDDTIRRCASYSFSPTPGFRIISLNNIYSSRLNLWLLVEDKDPCDVLKFFIEELQKAEDAGEKVHVLTHIPPGDDYMRKAWSWNYYKIVNRYENTIVNQFYGHTHTDFYEVFYDEVTFQRPLGVGFVAPSITAWTNLNPTYRIYTMDGKYQGSSWAVLDYDNYYLNLTKANGDHEAVWQLEYNPKDLFNMASIYAADWNDLTNRMEKDDDLFQKFYRVYRNMHPSGPCEGDCKKELLCHLREARSYDPYLCEKHTNNQTNNL